MVFKVFGNIYEVYKIKNYGRENTNSSVGLLNTVTGLENWNR